MTSLDELETFLRDGGTVDSEKARSIIQENARDGGLFRTAAEEGYLNAVKFFVEAGDRFKLTGREKNMCTNKDAASKKGDTPLHRAACNNHVGVVEYLLSSGALVNTKNIWEETPLHCASKQGHEDVVNLLVANGANCYKLSNNDLAAIDMALANEKYGVVHILLNAGCLSNWTLNIATRQGNEDMVRLLRQHGFSYEYHKDEYPSSPLHWAAKGGHLGIMRILLEDNEADPCIRNNKEKTPLHYAAKGGHVEIVRLLISLGVHLFPVDYAKRTPLHYAAEQGHVDTARLLLAHKASFEDDVDPVYDCNRNTSLHFASRAGHLDMVRLLVETGALLNAKNNCEYTAFDMALKKGHRDVALFLLSRGSVLNKSKLLPNSIENNRYLAVLCSLLIGADVNESSRYKYTYCTPLHMAVEKNDLDIIRLLLQRKANVNATNEEQEMPIHLASTNGRECIVKLLIQYGALVDALNEKKETPLHHACENGAESVAKLLIDHGALVNALTSRGDTPLFLARYFTNLEFLLQRGADPHAIAGNGKTVLHSIWSPRYAHSILKRNVLVDARDVKGNTPLHYQCKLGNKDFVELLIKYGASTNTKNQLGDTPLKLAFLQYNFDVAKLLIENDADLTVTYRDGETLLHSVSHRAQSEAANLLLKLNLDVNIKDVYANTPLHKATEAITNITYDFGEIYMCKGPETESERKNVAQILIEYGAQVNAVNKLGRTPLHNVVEWAGREFVDFLLQKGANPLYRCNSGTTPFEIARAERNCKIVSILENYVSKISKGTNV